jgi:hypothetical protein
MPSSHGSETLDSRILEDKFCGLGLGLEGLALVLASRVRALALRVLALVLRVLALVLANGLGLEGPDLGLGLRILALTTSLSRPAEWTIMDSQCCGE